MKSQVGPGSKVLNSVDDFKAATSKDEVIVIGFFSKDSELKTAFLSLADKLREKVSFAHSTNEEVLSAAGIKWARIFIVSCNDDVWTAILIRMRL